MVSASEGGFQLTEREYDELWKSDIDEDTDKD